ncbi:MAG: hypothetical protein LBB05_01570 [Puniceicoccales bacterium]|nr:hypothetical protein [Puniceicoccales bacterium]
MNVFLASHHGSTENGEFLWIGAIFENVPEKARFLFISSDPNQSNHLPRPEFYGQAQRLFFNGRYLTSSARTVCYRLSVEMWCSNIAIFDGAIEVGRYNCS